MEACPPTSPVPKIVKTVDEDDIFYLAEEGGTFITLPRLGLGGSYAVFSDGSYALDWSPKF